MHTGFSNSFLTQYVSTAAKESGTRLVEAAGSQHNSTVEASQVGLMCMLASPLRYSCV